jgi:hypothetical protein
MELTCAGVYWNGDATFAGLVVWSLGEWGHGMVFSLSDRTEITPSSHQMRLDQHKKAKLSHAKTHC